VIVEVTAGGRRFAQLTTAFGRRRKIEWLPGDSLSRICRIPGYDAAR